MWLDDAETMYLIEESLKETIDNYDGSSYENKAKEVICNILANRYAEKYSLTSYKRNLMREIIDNAGFPYTKHKSNIVNAVKDNERNNTHAGAAGGVALGTGNWWAIPAIAVVTVGMSVYENSQNKKEALSKSMHFVRNAIQQIERRLGRY